MSDLPHPGHLFAGRYAIEREIGRGGMATVYLATDVRHSRPVALKVLSPELAAAMGPDRFIREIGIAARLAHPHIVPLHDSGECDGSLFFVMPYIEGETLDSWIRREGRLRLEDALRITREVAEALGYAHEHGIVHRDIKPGNILLQAGHAVVADFGIARAIERATAEKITNTGASFGTPAYMSPEQSAGDPELDGRTDIYSLGCVLFEMLTGAPPNAVVTRYQLPAPEALRTLRPDAPPAMTRALGRALAPERDQRFGTAEQFAVALARAVGDAPRRKRARAAAGVAGLAALGLAAWWNARRETPEPDGRLDGNLIAVAPFYVASSEPELRAWKDHLALIVQQRLDGAGPLRALSPSVAANDWPGVADRASARELGHRTRAGLVAFGTVLETAPHAFRVNAAILDVAQDLILDEVQADVAGPRHDLDQLLAQLSDSLAHGLLTSLGGRTAVAAVGRAAFGCASSSWPAVRAYLRGEQFYRRTMWDSATAAYMDAIAIDSTCALAYRRVAIARAWRTTGGDDMVRDYKLRAGANNRGLAPRDSFLVTADSLMAAVDKALDESVPATTYWRLARRLLATLGEAARRYPGDPEVWYSLGDARFHFGWGPTSVTPREIQDAFDRSIALDSGFAPSYIHPIEIGFALGGDTLARRYARGYLARDPVSMNADGVRLALRLLDAVNRRSADTKQALDTASADVLAAARAMVDRHPDSAETAVMLAQLIALRAGADSALAPAECGERRLNLARRLARRGHVRAARCALGENPDPRLFAELAMLGAVPPDSAEREFDRWLETSSNPVTFALPWWAERGDTLLIHRALQRARDILRDPPSEAARQRAMYDSASVLAYLALARRDTTALERFASLPDTLCRGCSDFDRLKEAQLLASADRLRDAKRILEGWRGPYVGAMDMVFTLELGRIAERLDDPEGAITSYRTVVETWMHADSLLHPAVAEAQAAVARLTRGIDGRPDSADLTTGDGPERLGSGQLRTFVSRKAVR